MLNLNDTRTCPNCQHTEHARIDASGSEYAALIINECGSVTLSVCLNCGTVYLDSRYIERIRDSRKRRRKYL